MQTDTTSTTSTTSRAIPPTETSNSLEDLCFRVWAFKPSYSEDKLGWKCIAAFRFLMECLEFIDYCHSRECDVVFQSPAHTSLRVAPVRVELTVPEWN